jgi:hypothetical protein
MIRSWNNLLACRPFKTTEVTADKSKYFAMVETKNALEGLLVLFGTENIPAGSTVYVLAEHKKSAWALPNQTVNFQGQEMIFVPVQDVRLVQFPSPSSAPLPPSTSST